jgi:hypothetical protein
MVGSGGGGDSEDNGGYGGLYTVPGFVRIV